MDSDVPGLRDRLERNSRSSVIGATGPRVAEDSALEHSGLAYVSPIDPYIGCSIRPRPVGQSLGGPYPL